MSWKALEKTQGIRSAASARPGSIFADGATGLALAGLLLPEAVAYAGIAGLAPQRALFAAVAGCLAYVMIGRSRFAFVAPTSSSAAILAAALANLGGTPAERGALATLIVGISGLFFVAGAAAGLGRFAGFISRPVLKGFASGLAVTIILRQLPLLLGQRIQAPTLTSLISDILTSWASIQPWSLAVGLCGLTLLLALRRFPAFPAAFAVLVLGILVSFFLDLSAHGVATVGRIEFVWPTLPRVTGTGLSHAAQLTVPLVLILFAESWGTMRSLGLRHGETLQANRELGAIGLANLASAAISGMPVGSGFSAGSMAEAAGVRTRAAAVIAALGLSALAVFGRDMIAFLPKPVLAAIVISALLHALDPRPFVRLWRLDRDRFLGPAAAVGVIVLGVVNGMLLAIGLSVGILLQRLATPLAVQLGRLGNSHDFVDVARHREATPPERIAIWRPAEPLFFANADQVFALVEGKLSGTLHIRAVVLSLEESFDLDSTALEALLEFEARLKLQGLPLHLARVRDAIKDLLVTAGAMSLVERCGFSVDDAVRMAEAEIGGPRPSHGVPDATS